MPFPKRFYAFCLLSFRMISDTRIECRNANSSGETAGVGPIGSDRGGVEAEHFLFFSTRLNAFDSFAIHTRRAPIGFYLLPCLPKHVRAPHLVVQTVELQSFRLLACAI